MAFLSSAGRRNERLAGGKFIPGREGQEGRAGTQGWGKRRFPVLSGGMTEQKMRILKKKEREMVKDKPKSH